MSFVATRGCALSALAMGICIAMGSAPARADELGEIIVTGEQPTVSAISTTYQISAPEIQLRNDHTLTDVMENVPGVNVRIGGQGHPLLDIRGLRTRQIKLLIDGIPYNSTADGQFDPDLIPTEGIARVKVTTGGVSELYGAGAMAVINVITQEGTPQPHYSVGAEFGQGGYRRVHGTASGSEGKLGYFAAVTSRDQSGYPLSGNLNSLSRKA